MARSKFLDEMKLVIYEELEIVDLKQKHPEYKLRIANKLIKKSY